MVTMAPSWGAPWVGDTSPLVSAARCAPGDGRRRHTALLAVALAGALTISACGQPGRHPAAGASRTPQALTAPAAGVDYRDATAVCDGFTHALLTVDATTDIGPIDALRRTAPFVTATLGAAFADDGRRDLRWQDLTSHQAHTSVVTDNYAGDADAADRLHTARLATITTTGANGWTSPTQTTIIYCTLVPSLDGLMRVDEYSTEPLGSS